MALKGVYIEITNVCNLSCPFCPPLSREARVMSAAEFAHILQEVSPYCKNIYLHVRGEPLLHPQLEEVLWQCERAGCTVILTTNGCFLPEQFALLERHAPILRGINISLQSYLHYPEWQSEVGSLLESIDALNRECGLNIILRLWNGQLDMQGEALLAEICQKFSMDTEKMEEIAKKRSTTIRKGLFISRAEEFDWPGQAKGLLGEVGFCYGAQTQLAVLSDGTVVPCCLDAEGTINLGNLLTSPFAEILGSARVKTMREGFEKAHVAEKLCQTCTYKNRFDAKAKRILQRRNGTKT